MKTQLLKGDNLELLPTLADNSIDAIVTDPPYELGFMGKSWDSSGIAYKVALWAECLRVLKPGGHLIAFGGSRTYHRLACAVEDAGFEIRDQLMWVYGSGFPKSLDVSKAIDKAAGAEREVIATNQRSQNRSDGWDRPWMKEQMNAIGGHGMAEYEVTAPNTDDAKTWQGWGTALKPSHEPMVLARKPLGEKTVAENVLRWGTGALNIDGTRIGSGSGEERNVKLPDIRGAKMHAGAERGTIERTVVNKGRWPANFIHDGSDEVLELFPETRSKSGGKSGSNANPMSWAENNNERERFGFDDAGSAARFFYCAKASKAERNAGLDALPIKRPDTRTKSGMGTFDEKGVQPQRNFHPTVKPIALMRYLIRLVTPPNGTVLDPFAGSGTTLVAAIQEKVNSIGIELTEDYWPIIEGRTQHALCTRCD